MEVTQLQNANEQLQKENTELGSQFQEQEQGRLQATDAFKTVQCRVILHATEAMQSKMKLLQKEKQIQEQQSSMIDPNQLSDKDALLNEELKRYRTLLRCSICKTKMKDALIGKCYHSFCKGCLEKNVDTRVRKCPYCKTKFGHEDIKSFYWE